MELSKLDPTTTAINLYRTDITDAGLEHLKGLSARGGSTSPPLTSRTPGWSH